MTNKTINILLLSVMSLVLEYIFMSNFIKTFDFNYLVLSMILVPVGFIVFLRISTEISNNRNNIQDNKNLINDNKTSIQKNSKNIKKQKK